MTQYRFAESCQRVPGKECWIWIQVDAGLFYCAGKLFLQFDGSLLLIPRYATTLQILKTYSGRAPFINIYIFSYNYFVKLFHKEVYELYERNSKKF